MYKILVISLFIASTRSLPHGAPTKVCQTMLPIHGGGIEAQIDTPPYVIEPLVTKLAEGSRLRLSLGSKQGIQFQGFMLQGRSVQDGTPLGTFVAIPETETKTMDCGNPGDSVTHLNTDKKGPLEFEWEPPSNFLGDVIFKATVAQNYATFWVGFDSPIVKIVKRSDVSETDFSTTTLRPKSTTPPHFIPQDSQEVSAPEDLFYKGCYVEKGCFGAPEGCIKTKNCKAAVATIVRGERYEFELKAPKDAAYVAVGLSADERMGNDSVIECVREKNGARPYLSRTIPRPNLGVVRLPRPMLGIEMINFNITDGVLYCKVRRDIKTMIDGVEYDLLTQKYHLLVAAGTKLKGNASGFHDIAYLASGEKRYLTDVSEVAGASKLLLRLHGAFMIIAWVGTASVGILLARYFRQTWVGHQLCGKDLWFAWHRIFMVTTWALTVAGFIIIFLELRAWSTERNPHAILGLVTTIICFLQPIGAYFRPHPGTPKRPLFNWMHWLGGNVAHILAIVTIFFAVKLNKAELPEWMDWILVAFVAFHVCMHLIFSLYSWLQILGCLADQSAERRVTSFPMKDLAGVGRNNNHMNRKADAPNSPLRKILLAIYLIIIVLLVAALVVVTVLAPFEQTWNNLKNSVMQK